MTGGWIDDTVIAMTVHRTVTAIAKAPIRFGAFVAVSDGTCVVDPERASPGGIAKRPQGAGVREAYQAGEEVIVLTDGGVLADLADGQRWVEVASGRLAETG
ncbi:hypothetical protein FHS31_002941 [Sphingomonas vulcanisoli]|uniref:Uncharacterized protein n=1 Tax=Sphingomonas vulcanisoli TaxID=1658060 RepID=A0ABX0TUV5_9SPHN|nr:hypothetical protein [Sphingomonas vulcanisoli]NIJ09309.1 hypothetical protein [Sphingomonas vulcanisoli]